MGSNESLTGAVTAQSAAGETVTITVTKALDGTTKVLTTTTNADLSFAPVVYTDIDGKYSAVAHIGSDAGFASASSTDNGVPPFDFILSTLVGRSITLGGTNQ